ncbi:hypothetical protein K1719_008548 [Acacia pycnantha]|nr:hypothetical protein K1719_008548 [Acacia pycnantha]
MSAAVCGSKRSFFEDFPPSPPVSKRLRCSSSPIRFSTPSLVDQLQAVFPQMEVQANNKNNNDDDNDCTNYTMLFGTCTLRDGGHASASENQSASNDLPADGAEWVDLFAREMMS